MMFFACMLCAVVSSAFATNGVQEGTCSSGCYISGTLYPANTPQIPGNCQGCNPANSVTNWSALNTNTPADAGNQCLESICDNGIPTTAAYRLGTACTQSGGKVCDGNGNCVQCNLAEDCPGIDNECQKRTCNSGVCGMTFVAANTVTQTQTAGDCQKQVCDGAGQIISVADNTDIPADDGNSCTSDICSGGVPSLLSNASGTICAVNGGSGFCDGNGSCLQCLTAMDCPSNGNQCQSPECNNGTCSFTDLAVGTFCGSGYTCNGSGTCGTSCDADADCYSGYICNANHQCVQ